MAISFRDILDDVSPKDREIAIKIGDHPVTFRVEADLTKLHKLSADAAEMAKTMEGGSITIDGVAHRPSATAIRYAFVCSQLAIEPKISFEEALEFSIRAGHVLENVMAVLGASTDVSVMVTERQGVEEAKKNSKETFPSETDLP